MKTIVFILFFALFESVLAQAVWLKTTNGCAVWNAKPQPNETATWYGPCVYNKASGYGVLMWQSVKNGQVLTSRYEGRMRNGKRHGQGVYIRSNGVRYEGGFKNDKRHGRGIYVDSSGNRYEGEVREGRPNGVGILVYADGNRYEGNWVNGTPHGQGVMDFKDTTRFKGRFIKGIAQGIGQCRALDGKKGRCEYKDGQFIGWR